MADKELSMLEARINELIDACTHLKEENKTLRASQETLVSERASLIEKTEMARNRVEAMISRLKSLEDHS
ncbi:MAG: TIGR02449 family protein [Gammaproteobacteria bacterium]|jgi:cell division protein ZapB